MRYFLATQKGVNDAIILQNPITIPVQKVPNFAN